MQHRARPGWQQNQSTAVRRKAEFTQLCRKVEGAPVSLELDDQPSAEVRAIAAQVQRLSRVLAQNDETMTTLEEEIQRDRGGQGDDPETQLETLKASLQSMEAECRTLGVMVSSAEGGSVSRHYDVMRATLESRLASQSQRLAKLMKRRQRALQEIAKREYRFRYGREQPMNVTEMEGGDQSLQFAEPSQQDAVRRIQASLHDISLLFGRVTALVAQQEDLVESISAHVEDAHGSLEAGRLQLEKYLGNLTGSRWLIVKIFALFITFLVFFIAVVL